MAIRKCHFKLCTFDVTNTLLKFKISVGEQYAKVGQMYGVEREPEKITAAFRHHWKIMTLNHPNFGRKSGFTSQEWWKEMVRRTFSTGSFALDGNQLNLISSHLFDIYSTDVCWKVVAGTEDLLQHLNENNIMIGVISNFDERLDSVLQSTGLKSHFSFILASYLVGHAKPSSKIFDLAMMKMPGILNSEALHIGDDVKLDYLAAKEAGWESLLLKHKELSSDDFKYVKPNDIVENIYEINDHVFYS